VIRGLSDPAQVVAGVREGDECRVLDWFIGAFEVIPLTCEIAQRGGLYRRDYGPSHGVGLADALIAATAELNGACLVTLKARHFPNLSIQVPYSKD
jgi:predicted nucleic acid-binding protein